MFKDTFWALEFLFIICPTIRPGDMFHPHGNMRRFPRFNRNSSKFIHLAFFVYFLGTEIKEVIFNFSALTDNYSPL